ncbi:MAG: proline--tRNA ligase, partial [Dehalococcoidia bacterium]
EADSGAIGGKDSHEFMVLTPTGEDEVIHCQGCGYAANAEKAGSVKAGMAAEEPLPLEEVSTPGVKTIDELSRFLGIPPMKTLKAVFYMADERLTLVLIRGDLEVNETKLRNRLQCTELRLATEEELGRAGLEAGFASPVGLKGIRTIGDPSIASGNNLVAGGNKKDTHIKNVNYSRDFQVDTMADIALARAGEGCPNCGRPLLSSRGIEVGHVFKLETFISQKLNATFLDRDGISRPIVMGCYGIGLGRLLAAVVEYSHDEQGIIWPSSIGPYQIYLCPIQQERPEVASAAQSLYGELEHEGMEVLFDDREESPGVKFSDADLLGIPLRVVLSPRTLKEGRAEVKWRQEKDAQLLPLEGITSRIREMFRAGGVAETG